MEGRFFVPVLPVFYLLVEQSLRFLFRRRTALAAAAAVLLLTSGASRPLIPAGTIWQGITDERTWGDVFRIWYREGLSLGRHLPPGTLVATDTVGAFGFASGLPIVDTLGITDTVVAHQPLERRSRPGHEKRASMEYLESRSVEVVRDGLDIYRGRGTPLFHYGGNSYYLLTEDEAVAEGLRRAAAELSGAKR